MKKQSEWSEDSLWRLILGAHPAGEWACLRHVRDGGGWNRRTCDALAMGLWPSRGLILRGFEVKITRADFRREADDPTKAEAVAKFCDEWWLVTPPGLVPDPEIGLPPLWGLMEPGNGGLTVRRKAGRLDPAPITRGFLAQLFKGAQAGVAESLQGMVPVSEIEDRIERARAEGKAEGQGLHMSPYLQNAVNRLDAFKAITGIDIMDDTVAVGDQWDRLHKLLRKVEVGAAVEGKYGGDLSVLQGKLDAAAKQAAEIAKAIKTLTKDIEP